MSSFAANPQLYLHLSIHFNSKAASEITPLFVVVAEQKFRVNHPFKQQGKHIRQHFF